MLVSIGRSAFDEKVIYSYSIGFEIAQSTFLFGTISEFGNMWIVWE